MKLSNLVIGGTMLFGLTAAAKPTMTITFDNPQAVYKCGETAKIAVKLDPGDMELPPDAKIEFCRYDASGLSRATMPVSVANGKFSEEIKSENPAFVKVSAKLVGAPEECSAWAVCAFDPERIDINQAPPPADFMEFWKKEITKAMEIPMDVKLEREERLCDALADDYKISFANVDGTRMYGYISIPKGKGPFPACLTIPGAGPGNTAIPAEYPRGKVIAMTLNVHAHEVEPATAQARYDELNKAGIYTHKGIENPETFYFHRTILGLCRGVKYLTELPDWDHKHLLVWGSSQGGAMTLATTALNSDVVTAAAVNVPAMCGLHACNNGASAPGWPVDSKLADKYADTLKYYDGVNFAHFIKCPMIFGVGFVDTTCPPWTVFAAYNQIKTPKMIWVSPWMGHDLDPAYTKYRINWIAEQLGVK